MGSRYNWANEDGLVVHGGTRTSENDQAGKVSTANNAQEISLVVVAGDIAQGAGALGYGAAIPAGASIIDVQLIANGALTGLTNLVVGLTDADGGSDITDADALVLAADAAEIVALRPSGTVVGSAFDGVALTAAAPLAEAAVVTFAAATASTAGDVKVVVKYVM